MAPSVAEPASTPTAAPADRPKRRRGASRGRTWAARALTLGASVALVIGFWWLLAAVIGKPLLMPTPAATFDRLIELAHTGEDFELWPNIWASTQRVVLGWAAAVVCGVLVGSLMARSTIVNGLVDPVVEFARPIPPLAYAPLFIVWFGIGETPKLLVIFAGCLPTMIITTAAAVRGIDASWLRAAQTLGASRLFLFRKVILPASLPEIFTGMRIASGFAWGVLVAAEILASTDGLGWMIVQSGRFLDTKTIFVGIVTIGLLAFAMDRILRLVEMRFAPWRSQAGS